MSERMTNISLNDAAEIQLSRAGFAFACTKLILDKLFVLMLLPGTVFIAIFLLCVNPIWNPGPLLYRQKRMGKGCQPFVMFKFRSMLPAADIKRGPEEIVETTRITALGRFLRRTRIDELPQIFNVLCGDMSLIGPRPDYWEHAIYYLEHVPGYKKRHAIRPGITGLAQVTTGYAEGSSATTIKTKYDLIYIRRLGLRIESFIILRTFTVVLSGFGAR